MTSFSNKDLAPVSPHEKTWTTWNFAALWISMSLCIPTYMMSSSLIEGGMNWWQAILTILFGNLIVLIPMILNGKAGAHYGLSFPVLSRASFGLLGANIPALLRAIVACGWFGIQTWIGGHALYQALVIWVPSLSTLPTFFPPALGLETGPALTFLLFWLINMAVVYFGVESIRKLLHFKALFLPLAALALLFWAIQAANGLGPILEQPSKFHSSSQFWAYFFPALTGMVGFWATLSLNIPDFTRYAKSHRAQWLGQALGLPLSMASFSFVGVVVTSATTIIYGSTIWDPVQLAGKFQSPLLVTCAMMAVVISTLATNIAANIVSPANDFAHLAPDRIDFKIGGYITGILGILICPWKLISDPSGFIFTWLIAYSALLGPIGGIMIVDYYLIQKQNLDLDELYTEGGKYWYQKGFNLKAVLALILGILPNVPGFLITIKVIPSAAVWPWLAHLYHYAWFIGFALSGLTYFLFSSPRAKSTPTAFDKIAQDYQDSKQLPFRPYAEEYTLFKYLGPLEGKTVLDLACGEGIYARKMKRKGASKVMGLDLSGNILKLAIEEERKNPLGGLEYHVHDASIPKKMGEFDLILAAYLLNYAQNRDHLLGFLKNISLNLKPGGKLVGINDNPANHPEFYSLYRKYGFIKSCPAVGPERTEGSAVTYTLFNPNGTQFHFDNYFLKPSTYESAFKEAGFSFTWHALEISPEGLKEHGMEYWADFLNHPPLIGFEAIKFD